MKTFTVYKINLDGSLSHKEHLNNDELDSWMLEKYGKFATVQVTCDQTLKTITYTDNGQEWVKIRVVEPVDLSLKISNIRKMSNEELCSIQKSLNVFIGTNQEKEARNLNHTIMDEIDNRSSFGI